MLISERQKRFKTLETSFSSLATLLVGKSLHGPPVREGASRAPASPLTRGLSRLALQQEWGGREQPVRSRVPGLMFRALPDGGFSPVCSPMRLIN